LADTLVDPDRPGDFNQALMELGAVVCTPRNPRCGDCPLSTHCAALARGTVRDRPVARERASVPEVEVEVWVVVARDQAGIEHFLLRKRPLDGLLAGMWEFPAVEMDSEELSEHGSREGAEGRIFLETVAHAFTHLKIRYHPVLLHLEGASPMVEVAPPGMAEAALPVTAKAGRVDEMALPGWVGRDIHSTNGSRYRWVPVDDLSSIPLPVAQAKIAEAARERLKA
jgi:A/G-specific adenine glycosylase